MDTVTPDVIETRRRIYILNGSKVEVVNIYGEDLFTIELPTENDANILMDALYFGQEHKP